jgi:hypothetical protein
LSHNGLETSDERRERSEEKASEVSALEKSKKSQAIFFIPCYSQTAMTARCAHGVYASSSLRDTKNFSYILPSPLRGQKKKDPRPDRPLDMPLESLLSKALALLPLEGRVITMALGSCRNGAVVTAVGGKAEAAGKATTDLPSSSSSSSSSSRSRTRAPTTSDAATRRVAA